MTGLRPDHYHRSKAEAVNQLKTLLTLLRRSSKDTCKTKNTYNNLVINIRKSFDRFGHITAMINM